MTLPGLLLVETVFEGVQHDQDFLVVLGDFEVKEIVSLRLLSDYTVVFEHEVFFLQSDESVLVLIDDSGRERCLEQRGIQPSVDHALGV